MDNLENKEEHPLKAQIAAELAKYESPEQETIEEKAPEKQESSETRINEEVGIKQEEAGNKTSEDPYLKEALEMGFNPNYQGANKKSPEQFVRDGSFFKKIDELKRENKDIKDILKQQVEHTRKVEKAAYEKALREVRQEKLALVNQGDVEGFQIAEQKEQVIEQQIAEYEPKPEIIPQPQQELSEEVKEFTKKNEFWLNQNTPENKEMIDAALLIDNFIAKQNHDRGIKLSQREHLQLVEDRIQKLYPHRFENPRTKKASSVAISTSSEDTRSSLSSKLSSRQKEFLKAAQRYDSSLTADEYAKQLKLTGDLRDE